MSVKYGIKHKIFFNITQAKQTSENECLNRNVDKVMPDFVHTQRPTNMNTNYRNRLEREGN